MADPAELAALLADLRAEMADAEAVVTGLLARAGAGGLALATPAEGWTVHDTVGHLAFFDARATLAARDPAAFTAELGELLADPDGYLAAAVARMRTLDGAALLAEWRRRRAELLRTLGELAERDPAARLPWYGPPMGLATFGTARLMEYWAHLQDVADAVGVRRTPTARLRHVADLGVRTRRFSYANRGLAEPASDVRVELRGPGGELWTWGPAGAADAIRGDAEEFALLVTQRRHRADLSLQVSGPAAAEWAALAQAYAGPPGPGRAPLTG